MRRALCHTLCVVWGVGVCVPVIAQQDRQQTLADIRQELSVLFVDIQRLRSELNTTGGVQGTGQGGSIPTRLDAIELELRRLTALSETLELRINQVVRDGTNRIGDLEFRLCELESGCDPSRLGGTPTLGGVDVGGAAPPITITPQTPTTGTNLAVAEQTDFDRARTAFDTGDYTQAAQLFETFTQTYPGGPLSPEAHFFRGQSHAQLGARTPAARAYLDAFTADPDAPRAAEALYNLGTALDRLGQRQEACITLAEVATRYPGSPFIAQAQATQATLGCS